jgi:peptidoglycan/xylan/chitin deacetylase (PgdA/CDA1 family)
MSVHARVAILTYHSIAAETTETFSELTVHPLQFAEHMTALHEQDLDIITVAQVPAALTAGRRAVAITIDDGLADVEPACETLAALGLPATLFVPSGYVGGTAGWLPGPDGKRPVLSASAIRNLADRGFEIGSHGRAHLAADVNRGGLIWHDAMSSRRELEDCIGRAVSSFAYPFGYHSATGRRAVRDAGYAQACAVGDLPADPRADRFALPRLQVLAGATAEDVLEMTTRPVGPTARAWAHAKQGAWRLGRRWAGWGPSEAAPLVEGPR